MAGSILELITSNLGLPANRKKGGFFMLEGFLSLLGLHRYREGLFKFNDLGYGTVIDYGTK